MEHWLPASGVRPLDPPCTDLSMSCNEMNFVHRPLSLSRFLSLFCSYKLTHGVDLKNKDSNATQWCISKVCNMLI